jgi:acyl-homoserine lactone acylase PvdQ
VRRLIPLVAAALTLLALPALAAAKDTARYILPPGNFGGLPTNQNSLDQLPLYDGLTPLRGEVTAADLSKYFLPEDFLPIGKTHTEDTGRKGLRLVYDIYGIPHVYGKTRADMAFGAGWTTARDRGLLLQLGRGPARAAVADVPGIDAFGLVTSGQSFVPSAQAEALVTKQQDVLKKVYGKKKGGQIIEDAQAYADGATAYNRKHGSAEPPFTVNDVLATTAFIGSIFGAGGGGEAQNSDLLARLQGKLGAGRGKQAWEDVMLADDPEAPTTISKRFSYGPLTGGKVTGSVTVDAGSIVPLDPRATATAASRDVTVNAADAPPRRQASNFQVVAPSRSKSGNSLAVMGPQLGYFYPEIVQQIDLHGPGIKAQGAAVPGLAMYILIGRTQNYAWSLTSAGHDVRDVFAEELCNADGSPATRASKGYRYKGKCRAFSTFVAGTLGGKTLSYPVSVHGPVTGTATVGGKPYALSRKRSTFGRDALNLGALKDMTEGKASTPKRFWKTANQFGFTFNWAYASRKATAYFSSGYLPKRARGLDRRLPTLGTGRYEWTGFLPEAQHPHDTSGPNGLLINWNNRSAPGFMHGDDEPYGSFQRVEMFDQWPKRPRLADVASVMNRAATEDLRGPVWPVIRKVLAKGTAPNARDEQVAAVLDDWVSRDAPRLDANNDGAYDDAGPVIMDRLWRPIADAVMTPVFGDLVPNLHAVRSLTGMPGESYVDKDLRTLVGEKVRGKFHVRYCGNGDLAACRASLWAALDGVAAALEAEQGPNPAAWRATAARTRFTPGLIPETFRLTNRPVFQQVLEFDRKR